MKSINTLLALAVSGALLAACHRDDGGPPVNVDQLNDLKGPTRTLSV